MISEPTPTDPKSCGLRKDCLSFSETLSQCVANISPTLTPVMIAPLVFASAGNGTWLAYFFATVGLVAVGFNINQFARRSATPGSLYSYITRGLGINAGFVAGWALIAAYLFTGMTVLSGCVNYAIISLALLKITVPPVVLYALGTLPAWYFAYKDVKLSTRLMLYLEVVSMLLILILGVIVVVHRGRWLDAPQFRFRGMDFAGLKTGLILAIFSFVGYESATTLGAEARRPLVNIPRAVILSAVIAGLFFMVTSYISVLGFRGLPGSLATATAPLNDLANDAGAGYFGVLISLGAIVSTFACTLASITAGARIVFSMGRLGVLHAHLGKAHPANETPHHSATLCSILVFAVPAALVARHVAVIDVFNDLGTIATYGFLIAYALIALAAPAYVRSLGKPIGGSLLVCGISIVFLAPAFVSAVYPAPPPPLRWLPYYFLGYMLAGIAWFYVRRRRSGAMVAGIKADLAALHASFAEETAK